MADAIVWASGEINNRDTFFTHAEFEQYSRQYKLRDWLLEKEKELYPGGRTIHTPQTAADVEADGETTDARDAAQEHSEQRSVTPILPSTPIEICTEDPVEEPIKESEEPPKIPTAAVEKTEENVGAGKIDTKKTEASNTKAQKKKSELWVVREDSNVEKTWSAPTAQNTGYRQQYPRASWLTMKEHALYLQLHKKYATLTATKQVKASQNKELQHYKELHQKVIAEQEEYMVFSEVEAARRPIAYFTLREDAAKFTTEYIANLCRRVINYDRFYVQHGTIPLANKSVTCLPLVHIKCLLQLGVVPRIFLPQFENNRIKLPVDYKRVTNKYPTNSSKDKKPTCSQDENAEKLAMKYAAEVIISASSIKCLLDHGANMERQWELPVVVKEHVINDVRGKRTVKVVYVDKPLPPKTMMTSQKNAWFHKFAWKTQAVHMNHNSRHVFSQRQQGKEVDEEPTPSIDDLETFGVVPKKANERRPSAFKRYIRPEGLKSPTSDTLSVPSADDNQATAEGVDEELEKEKGLSFTRSGSQGFITTVLKPADHPELATSVDVEDVPGQSDRPTPDDKDDACSNVSTKPEAGKSEGPEKFEDSEIDHSSLPKELVSAPGEGKQKNPASMEESNAKKKGKPNSDIEEAIAETQEKDEVKAPDPAADNDANKKETGVDNRQETPVGKEDDIEDEEAMVMAVSQGRRRSCRLRKSDFSVTPEVDAGSKPQKIKTKDATIPETTEKDFPKMEPPNDTSPIKRMTRSARLARSRYGTAKDSGPVEESPPSITRCTRPAAPLLSTDESDTDTLVIDIPDEPDEPKPMKRGRGRPRKTPKPADPKGDDVGPVEPPARETELEETKQPLKRLTRSQAGASNEPTCQSVTRKRKNAAAENEESEKTGTDESIPARKTPKKQDFVPEIVVDEEPTDPTKEERCATIKEKTEAKDNAGQGPRDPSTAFPMPQQATPTYWQSQDTPFSPFHQDEDVLTVIPLSPPPPGKKSRTSSVTSEFSVGDDQPMELPFSPQVSGLSKRFSTPFSPFSPGSAHSSDSILSPYVRGHFKFSADSPLSPHPHGNFHMADSPLSPYPQSARGSDKSRSHFSALQESIKIIPLSPMYPPRNMQFPEPVANVPSSSKADISKMRRGSVRRTSHIGIPGVQKIKEEPSTAELQVTPVETESKEKSAVTELKRKSATVTSEQSEINPTDESATSEGNKKSTTKTSCKKPTEKKINETTEKSSAEYAETVNTKATEKSENNSTTKVETKSDKKTEAKSTEKKSLTNKAESSGPISTLDQIMQAQESLLKAPSMKSEEREATTTTTESKAPAGSIPFSIVNTKSDPTEWEPAESTEDYQLYDQDNLTYNLWLLGNTRLIIRCGIHGIHKHQKRSYFVSLSHKMECQPNVGLEQETSSESVRNWVDYHIRHVEKILRVRVNGCNSDMMKIEKLHESDIMSTKTGFSPQIAISRLHSTLDSLKSGVYDLHKAYLEQPVGTVRDDHIPWIPIDPNLQLRWQQQQNRIPATFVPKDSPDVATFLGANKPQWQKGNRKQQGKNKKKKNKKKNKK